MQIVFIKYMPGVDGERNAPSLLLVEAGASDGELTSVVITASGVLITTAVTQPSK